VKTRNISKQLFKRELISILIRTPVYFGIGTLVIFVMISPFLEDWFSGHDSLYISAIISYLVTILPMWVELLFKHTVDPSKNRQKIEHVSGLIATKFDLSFDEVKLLNSVEEWEYNSNRHIRLKEKELKEAFLLANEVTLNSYARDAGYNPRTILGIITSFIMSLICLSGLKDWKNPSNWPIIGIGLLLLCFSLYLYRSFKKEKSFLKLKMEIRSQEVQEFERH
jgi:hypothetical protein